jgi:hypothetical protein
LTKYHRLKRRFHIGLDLGKKQDYSAAAILEDCAWATGAVDKTSYAPELRQAKVLRHVERFGKNLEYLRVIEKMRGLLVCPQLRHEEVVLSLDATGVGEPVFELIEKLFWEVKKVRTKWLNLAAVVFTSGEKTRWSDYHAYVPKNTLLEGLQVGMETGELWLADGLTGVREMTAELQLMRRAMGENGRRWVSAGKHDDLVMATALAHWGTTFRRLEKNWGDLKLGMLHWPPEAGRRV